MLGGTTLMPTLIVPAMGGTQADLARTISTLFFVSALNTGLQSTFGVRLPVFQGGSFAFVAPVLALAARVKGRQDWAATDAPDGSNHARFLATMREVQGGLIGASLLVMAATLLGVFRLILPLLSPLTVSANIVVIGLGLVNAGVPAAAACFPIAVPAFVLTVVCALYLRGVGLPLPHVRWKDAEEEGGEAAGDDADGDAAAAGNSSSVPARRRRHRRPHISWTKFRVFEAFPILIGLGASWALAAILTAAGVWKGAPPERARACSTTGSSAVVRATPWFRVPWPGQWGPPVLTWAGTGVMMAGLLPALVETLGDCFMAARIVGAPTPPPGVLARGMFAEGAACLLAGLFGTGTGSTVYNENLAALLVSRVGSRRVVQAGAVIVGVLALVSRLGAGLATIPQPIAAGLFCILFGAIAGVGAGQMRWVNQASPRNVLVWGVGVFMGLSVPAYASAAGGGGSGGGGSGPVPGAGSGAAITNALLHTGAAVALVVTVLLDTTAPAHPGERGMEGWLGVGSGSVWWKEDGEALATYGLPWGLTPVIGAWQERVRGAVSRVVGKLRPRRLPPPGDEAA
jgi:solute carrier family 23 (nucleobase transporter), member 1